MHHVFKHVWNLNTKCDIAKHVFYISKHFKNMCFIFLNTKNHIPKHV